LDETISSEELDIEELEDLSEVENSRELDNNALKKHTDEECQYDILDETDEYAIEDDYGLNIGEIEDPSTLEKNREVEDTEVKRESNEECQYDIFDEVGNKDEAGNKDESAFEAIIEQIKKADENKMQLQTNEDETEVIDGFINEDTFMKVKI
jgi:hypothetical protein